MIKLPFGAIEFQFFKNTNSNNNKEKIRKIKIYIFIKKKVN